MNKIVFGILIAALFLAGCTQQQANPTPSTTIQATQVACTQEAMQCPDGSFVGRDSNNNCQFTPCPSMISTQTVEAQVSIQNFAFNPAEIIVKKGTTVTWKNEEAILHWVASDPHPTHEGLPGFDAKKSLAQGEEYSFTFDKIGTFGYHCHTHPSMTGTVIVEE